MSEGPIRSVVVIDVETTGLDESADRLVEVALLILEPSSVGLGGGARELSFMLDVGAAISTGAQAVLGKRYTRSALSTPFSSIADKLYGHLHGATWVGYNLSFDVRFLRAEFARAGRAAPQPATLVDVADLCQSAFPGLGRLGLGRCCERAGVEGPKTLAPPDAVLATRRLADALWQGSATERR